MSVTKDSNVAAMANVKYKVAFRRVQWAFSIDQCISFLVYHCMIFIINKWTNNSHENSSF